MSEDQNSWVLDSLVGFLKGPIWNLAIQVFIEQKSVVFDPEEQSEDVTQEYRALYQEYKNLVDTLLSSHMSDLEISAEQFDDACRRADGILAEKFKQSLFEQIWAANDFQIFQRFMTQRNIELQLQALELLSQRFGTVYDSFVPIGTDKQDLLNDDLVINEAIKRSLEEEKDEESHEKEVLEEKQRLESEIIKEQQKLSIAIQEVINEPQKVEELNETPLIEPIVEEVAEESVETTAPEEESKDSGSKEGDSKAVKESLSVEEIRKRSEYLKKQRDKLLEIKKKERNKQMAKLEQQELLAKRPKSARAIRSVKDNTVEDSDGDQTLAFRRSLAARLKAEVIEKQKN